MASAVPAAVGVISNNTQLISLSAKLADHPMLGVVLAVLILSLIASLVLFYKAFKED